MFIQGAEVSQICEAFVASAELYICEVMNTNMWSSVALVECNVFICIIAVF